MAKRWNRCLQRLWNCYHCRVFLENGLDVCGKRGLDLVAGFGTDGPESPNWSYRLLFCSSVVCGQMSPAYMDKPSHTKTLLNCSL